VRIITTGWASCTSFAGFWSPSEGGRLPKILWYIHGDLTRFTGNVIGQARGTELYQNSNIVLRDLDNLTLPSINILPLRKGGTLTPFKVMHAL